MRHKILALSLLLIGSTLLSPLSLAEDTDPLTEPFTVTFEGESKTMTLAELGVQAEEIELSAWVNFWDNLLTSFSFYDSKVENGDWEFNWVKNISDLKLRESWGFERPVNAYYTTSDGILGIQPEVPGHYFDVDTLLTEVTTDYPNLESYELQGEEAQLMKAAYLEEKFDLVNALLYYGGFVVTDGEENYSFPAQMKDLQITQESSSVSISFDEPFLEYITDTLTPLTDSESTDLTLLSVDTSQVGSIEMDGDISDGRSLNAEHTRWAIQGAVESSNTQAEAVIDTVYGEIVNETGLDLGPLEHVATGVSNFYGSGSGRIHNVRKGLDEHLNGVFIPEGAELSFNSLLGGPVTYSNGWAGAYAIFGGNELITVPGGGICQTSTTVYRAALNAGLDITAHKTHSMYVSYYAAYGDGLDATIYPPSGLDLKFVNNTGAPIIMLASHDDNYDAFVRLYGTDDGREVNFHGPYTRSNQTDEVTNQYGTLGGGQIAWKQEIFWPDGNVSENWIKSSYNTYVKQY